MTRGLTDSASVYGVITALSHDKVDHWPEWAKQSAIEMTCALVNDHLLEIAPGPGPYAGAMGPYDHAMHELSSLVTDSAPEKAWLKTADQRVKSFVGRYQPKIRIAHETLFENKDFTEWLDWAIAHAWVWHSAMLEGLFNKGLIPELALLLDCTEGELRQVWKSSCDLRQVERWATKRPPDDEFRLATHAYTLAFLLRGRYHDHIAEAAHLHIMHHPLRDVLLPKKPQSAAFVPTNSERYFTSIILASALAERGMEARISVWAQNVIKGRNATREKAIDLRQKPSDSLAENLAIDAAKRLEIRTYSRTAVIAFDALLPLVCGLSWFGLSSWTGLPPLGGVPIGPTAYLAARLRSGKSPGDLGASWLYRRRGRLRNLARAVPGRITRGWK